MKKIHIAVISFLILAACTSKPELQDTSSDETVVSHQLPSSSEVRSLNNEYNEYINHNLGISIKVPKRVMEDDAYSDMHSNVTVPVRIIENGEIITFSRPSYPAWHYPNLNPDLPSVKEDLSERHPYYDPAYQDIPGYPYQIYAAKAETIDDVDAFMKRIYGSGCIADEASASRYENRPGLMTFTVGPKVNDCPGYSPIGDVVSWYQNEHVVIGVQTTSTLNFKKPYFVNPYGDVHDTYDFSVTVLP